MSDDNMDTPMRAYMAETTQAEPSGFVEHLVSGLNSVTREISNDLDKEAGKIREAFAQQLNVSFPDPSALMEIAREYEERVARILDHYYDANRDIYSASRAFVSATLGGKEGEAKANY